jgi:ferredoxin--NADP+ reductase
LIASGEDRTAAGNVQILTLYAEREPQGKPRRIVFRFLVSPVEIIGKDRVEAIKIVHNVLVKKDDGSLSAKATDKEEIIPVGLVFRSVGYKGVALPGVPFHEKWGIIPNDNGRVLTAIGGERVIGDYVVGWIKRGPSGIIGTNKPDSVETVNMLLEDLQAGTLLSPATPNRASLEALLALRGVEVVTYADWQLLDALEQSNGTAVGRPRLKFTRVDEMMTALAERKLTAPGD